MCDMEGHEKELRALTESMIRVETKLDSNLEVMSDHEARIRTAEAMLATHADSQEHHRESDARFSKIEVKLADHGKDISAVVKLLWAVGLAAMASLLNAVLGAVGVGG